MNTQQNLQIHTFELDTLKQSSCGQVSAISNPAPQGLEGPCQGQFHIKQ